MVNRYNQNASVFVVFLFIETVTSRDTINNVIQDTVAQGYVVTKSELFMTRNKSYRAYVLIEVKKSAFDI